MGSVQVPAFSHAAIQAIVAAAEVAGEPVVQVMPPEDVKEYAWLLHFGYTEAPDSETAEWCGRKIRELAEKFDIEFIGDFSGDQ